MLNSEQKKFLRKYWYVLALLCLAVLAGVVFLSRTNMDMSELLSSYGYLIILGWTFFEGETVVIVAGAAAASRSIDLDPPLIALCAFLGSFCSDQLMFSLGKYKGDKVLALFPRIGRNIDKAASLFKKYDTALILGFRFVYGVRNVTPILLGISGVSHAKFFLLNFIGGTVWAVSFTYGGFFAGQAFMRVVDHVGHGILYIILGVIVVAALLWFLRARISVKNAEKISRQGKENEP